LSADEYPRELWYAGLPLNSPVAAQTHTAPNLVAENIGYVIVLLAVLVLTSVPVRGLKANGCRINADAKSSDE